MVVLLINFFTRDQTVTHGNIADGRRVVILVTLELGEELIMVSHHT